MPKSSTSASGPATGTRQAEKRRHRSGDPRKRDPKSKPDARKAQQRFGSTVPRLFTPPLVTGDPGPCGCGCALTDATTLGFEAVRFAEQVVKVTLRPWQRWLLIHGLEVKPNGRFRFRKLVVLVARQNGKSILSVILSLFFMYVLETRTVLSAAQDLDTAEEIWNDGVNLVTEVDEDDNPVRPDLAAFKRNVVLVNGKKALVLTTGERWKVKAANRKAGRGLRGDLIILDELREQQNWYAWSAITKDLADSTPMLRADGTWATLRELVVGDRIFSPSGRPVTITKVVPIDRLRPMYRVTSTDGRSVLASESHLWTVRKYNNQRWQTLTTRQIVERGLRRPDGTPQFRLPQQLLIDGLPERDLPIDPYLLGAWLGDGTSSDGTLTVGAQDLDETCALLEGAGATVTSRIETRPGTWRVRLHVGNRTFRSILAESGLLGNKHVPAGYETASTQQRLALLQGLLDTDGCVTAKGCVRFSSTRKTLSDTVAFLARSLGWTAYTSQIKPRCGDRQGSDAWLVTFSVRSGDPVPFRLTRKADRCATSPVGDRLLTSIASIEPVESEPSRCIAVDSDDHLFLAGQHLIPTHNTTNARPNAQVWCFSNAGDITSVVLRHLRLKAHRKLGDPDGACAAADADAAPTDYDVDQVVADNPKLEGLTVDDLAIDVDDLFLAEWSAPPGCSIWDRAGWAWSNPSLGYGDMEESTIASDASTDPEWEFRTEVLCQWPDGALKGVFDPGTWQATTNQPLEAEDGTLKMRPADQLIGDVVAAFDVSKDGSRAYVAFAGMRADGAAQAVVVAAQPGTDWLDDWLMAEAGRIECVVAQERGAPASDKLQLLRADREFTIPLIGIGGSDLTAMHGRCRSLVRAGNARHNPQPVLDQAAAQAVTKPLGDNEVLDRRRSPVDVAPLMAWELALYQLTQPVTPRRPAPPAPMFLDAVPPSGSDFDPATAGF